MKAESLVSVPREILKHNFGSMLKTLNENLLGLEIPADKSGLEMSNLKRWFE